MVGIHALSIGPKSLRKAKANQRGANSTPNGAAAPLICSGPPGLPGVHAHKDLSSSLAFGDVFEVPGCPHKVADTRVNFTTDR
jgi:hypothetical protein